MLEVAQSRTGLDVKTIANIFIINILIKYTRIYFVISEAKK